MNLTRDQWLGHLAALAFSLCVAGSFSLGSKVARDIDPQAITAIRFLLATVVMGGFALASRTVSRRNLRAPWRYLLLGGLFSSYFVLMFEGLKTAGAVSAAAVFALVPLMSAGFGYVLLRQVTTLRMSVAILAAGVGGLWVVFRGDVAALAALDIGRGEMIYFVGCIAHAIYTPLVRMLNGGEPAVVFTFGTLLGGSLVMVAASWPSLRATDWTGLPVLVWITIGYLTIFSTAASFFLLQFATLRLPAAKAMAYSYLIPTWVIIWELSLGNGLPAVRVLPGILLTVVPLLLLLRDEEVS